MHAAWRGEELVILSAACGAGKSYLLRSLAAQAVSLRQRVLLGCQTNEQTIDQADRLARAFSHVDVFLFVKPEVRVPPHLEGGATYPRLYVVREARDLFPNGDAPCVVVANLHKTAYLWLSPVSQRGLFDVAFIDEAFQGSYGVFTLMRELAHRSFLVGDSGQIDTFTEASIERWTGRPGAPHLAAPRGLREWATDRGIPICELTMPVTRRLPYDSVAPVSAFYPDMVLEAIAAPGERGLSVTRALRPDAYDTTVHRLAEGASMVMLELPDKRVGARDPELMDAIVRQVERLRDRRVQITDHPDYPQGTLQADQVGVVVPHSEQVARLQAAVRTTWPGVLVETANRFQGLERAVIVAAHPLSGQLEADTFHADAGRLCVSVSRHRVACILVGRAGIAQRIRDTPYASERVARELSDAERHGRHAHLSLLHHLSDGGLTIRA
jgi:hypothetical protein